MNGWKLVIALISLVRTACDPQPIYRALRPHPLTMTLKFSLYAAQWMGVITSSSMPLASAPSYGAKSGYSARDDPRPSWRYVPIP